MPSTPTVVLVHGAFVDASSCARVKTNSTARRAVGGSLSTPWTSSHYS
ncbi:hypothetical protein [Streptomyces sp. NPDC058394]